MGTDFHILTEKAIAEFQGARAPRLLLHSCCAPCSSYVLLYLSDFFNITVLFYNPNIFSSEEYYTRLEWQKYLLGRIETVNPVSLIEPGWRNEEFAEASKGLEDCPEGGERCRRCFGLRLSECAKIAAEKDFDYFCSTLTVSPHKNARDVNSAGESAASVFGATWLPSDFKKRDGYKKSIELSRKYGLYRQNYCGCEFSQRKTRGD